MSALVTWIARPADERLAALLAGDARLISVHGLGGVGSSALVQRALAGVPHQHVDLEACRTTAEVRARLRRVRRGVVWLDQVHRPRLARAAVAALLAETGARVLIAGRTPLGGNDEECVPVALLDHAGAQQLLATELRRLGVPASADTATLAAGVGGWPLALRAVAGAVRTLGYRTLAQRGVLEAALGEPCRAVLEDLWRKLSPRAKELLAAVAMTSATLDCADAIAASDGALEALGNLVERGVVVASDTRVGLAPVIAAFVRARLSGPRRARANEQHARVVLQDGERARDTFRRDPVSAGRTLELLSKALLELCDAPDAHTAVRAALAVEPILAGRLERDVVLGMWSKVTRAAATLDAATQARVAIAHARTLITRGEHESAEELLVAMPAVPRDPLSAAYGAIYLGHIAAWRGTLPRARALLDDADRHLACPAARADAERLLDAREDARLQRIFVAFLSDDLLETERLCRICAEAARMRPSPRMAALARRFAAEVMLRRGDADRAVPLLERTRDDLASFGDRAGALFVWGRLIEALRAAGEAARATDEARAASALAARAGEGTLELAVLGALGEDDIAPARVAELSWHAQIPSLRDEAEARLGKRAREPEGLLRLDASTMTATLGELRAPLARRQTLWRILEALALAHARTRALSGDALFAVGWPDDHAEPSSRKKRVQTAIWALRRLLLREVLGTYPHGYALSQRIRVELT